MKYQQIGIPPEEAQFLETRKFQINEIARLYRIPPHMVGDLEKSSFSNIEQQSLEFVKYTLDPWVIRWEQSLQKSLLLPGEKNKYFIKLNVDGLLLSLIHIYPALPRTQPDGEGGQQGKPETAAE